MNQNLQGWFTEWSSLWPGQAFSLKVKKVLFEKKSQFQNIQIFESTNYGKVLVLDGVIQATERDEFSYQEMISFLPLNSHPDPKKVLIIGGGDGGVAREVAKHPSVQRIVQCEIDDEVIEACKTYIPSLACGFNSPKLTLYSGDGAKFLEETEEKFDVIITDSSDPAVNADAIGNETQNGPAATLFNKDYYCQMKASLNEGGILCCQGENMWLDMELICCLMRDCNSLFPVVDYAYTCTPSYTCGQIGFILCGLSKFTNFKEPALAWSNEEINKLSLKYYNASVHRASFALPTFMKKALSFPTQ